ncbi:MAG: ferritin [Candidatus Thorarchaeota archaeon]|nr:ferritin [Candidatus Thorarchaeota archaeon]
MNLEISKELVDAINDQINFELYSGYIYLSMATWFESRNLRGMAHWMEVQADEEYNHAIRFHRHVTERGGRTLLKEIRTPRTEWGSPLEVFEDALNHERTVTERIYKIGEIAERLGDRATQSFLRWFYNEQVEEEKNATENRDLIKMAKDSIPALLHIDARLGGRKPAGPAPSESNKD